MTNREKSLDELTAETERLGLYEPPTGAGEAVGAAAHTIVHQTSNQSYQPDEAAPGVEDDLRVVREALYLAREYVCGEVYQANVEEALAALDRIEARCIPELPSDWRWQIFQPYGESYNKAWVCVGTTGNSIDCAFGTKVDGVSADGPTPRAAVLAAIAKIEGER